MFRCPWLLIVFSLFLCLPGKAQTVIFRLDDDRVYLLCDDKPPRTESLGQASFSVLFTEKVMTDTLARTVSTTTTILQVSPAKSIYKNNFCLAYDSSLRAGRILWKIDPEIPVFYFDTYVNDLMTGECVLYSRLAADNFRVPIRDGQLSWSITDDRDTILGYAVVKAECAIGNRRYIAWYAPEIPSSAGPALFSGLPGLILKVEDTDGHYVYEATEFVEDRVEMYLNQYNYIEVSTKKIDELRFQFLQAPLVYFSQHTGTTGIKLNPSKAASQKQPVKFGFPGRK